MTQDQERRRFFKYRHRWLPDLIHHLDRCIFYKNPKGIAVAKRRLDEFNAQMARTAARNEEVEITLIQTEIFLNQSETSAVTG